MLHGVFVVDLAGVCCAKCIQHHRPEIGDTLGDRVDILCHQLAFADDLLDLPHGAPELLGAATHGGVSARECLDDRDSLWPILPERTKASIGVRRLLESEAREFRQFLEAVERDRGALCSSLDPF